MPVKRNEDGSITIRDENGMLSVGKVSAVFMPESSPEQEAKHEAWVEKYAQLIKPQPHTIIEVEEYFLQQYEAIPLDTKDSQVKGCYFNVVMNYCLKDRNRQLNRISVDMSDEEIEEWNGRQRELLKEVLSSTPEDYGLKIRGYYLPRTIRNQQIYEEKDPRWDDLPEEHKQHLKDEDEKTCFVLEETTGYMNLTGRGIGLYNRLIAYKGITDEDINLRNSNFHIYISVMRDLGYLPMEE
ncbi:MAG: hypothetical protein QM644_12250 [Mobilitalea sp.]